MQKVWHVFFSFSLLLSSNLPTLYAEDTTWVEVKLPNSQTIRAELAYTSQKRIRGLMFRRSLKPRHGMLFVMPEQRMQAFWMKNMKMALDILFLSDDGTITKIVESIPPPSENAQNIPRAVGFGRFVLELSAGSARAEQLSIGDRLAFELPFALESVH